MGSKHGTKFVVSGRRRGTRRAAAILGALALLALAGCGEGSASESEKEADVQILNAALGRELAAAELYAQGQPLLRGPYAGVGRAFRAQAEEHANALTKAIRGLGGESEPEPVELDDSGVKDQGDFLVFAYDLESSALAAYLEAAPRLETAAPRTLAAALAASHAQHLVVLRQGLGAGPVASVPEGFEPGDLPPPGRAAGRR
jgi:rubrerythrin